MSYARKCSITGKGMNEGWIILDGEMYIADEENALEQVKKVGYDSLEEAFDDEYCYWTEWDADDIDDEEE